MVVAVPSSVRVAICSIESRELSSNFGFPVKIMAGGMTGWIDEGFPVAQHP